jgi:DHA1 family tetracycline resistance protein-like MFS transporter
VYVTRHLGMDVLLLGYLLSTYGVTTMFSEGILVRLAVPSLGEMTCIRLGLLSYAFQITVIVFAPSYGWVFFSLFFSLFSNLVYPSICSLVTTVVDEGKQGEALGALNGIKSLTEGFGPLCFGLLMSLFESHPLPSAPYILVCFLLFWAFLHSYELSDDYDIAFGKQAVQTSSNVEAVRLLDNNYDFSED